MLEFSDYRNAVADALECPAWKKKAILSRLNGEFRVMWRDDPEPGMDKLVRVFGPPELKAAELLGSVSKSEITSARKRHIFLRAALCLLVLLVLGFMAYLIWFHSQPFKVVETIVIYPEETFTGTLPGETQPATEVLPGGIIVYPEEPYTGPWPPETEAP